MDELHTMELFIGLDMLSDVAIEVDGVIQRVAWLVTGFMKDNDMEPVGLFEFNYHVQMNALRVFWWSNARLAHEYKVAMIRESLQQTFRTN